MKKSSATTLAESGGKLHAVYIEEAEEQAALGERRGRIFSPASESAQSFQEVLTELRAPLGDMVKQRVGWTDRSGREHIVDYVEWHTVADILDRTVPDWSYTIRGLQQVGDLIAVTAAITINGVTREGVGTGPAGSEMGIKKAESDALKRAARMFGVARDLYKDIEDEDPIRQNGQTAQQPQQQTAASVATPASDRGRDLQGFPFDPLAHSTEDMVTPRQLVAIRAIANSLGIEAEAECHRLLKCDVKEISRRAASAFIDHLKARSAASRN